jgi:hypothetical protein
MPRMAVVHLMAENVQLRAKQARSDNRWARTLEWFANPNMLCAEKVVGFNLLIHQGAAPGVLPRNPLADVTPVVIAEIARISKLSPKQAGAHMDTLNRNQIIPVRQERVPYEPKPKPEPKPAGGTPQPEPKNEPEKAPPFLTVTKLLPIEGADAAILHPADIGKLEPSPRLDSRKKKAKEEREENKQMRARLKVLEARCPECGEIDPDKLSLVCSKCGCRTVTATLPDAKRVVRWGTRSRFKRHEEPHPIDADGNPLPPAATEHCSVPQPQQQEMFPAPPAAPVHTSVTGAEIRARKATQESLASPQQSVGSAVEQCSGKYKTYTNTTSGGPAEECSAPSTPAVGTEHCSGPGPEAAAKLLYDVFGLFDEHIVMRQGSGPNKYITAHAPLTLEILQGHLRGEITVGGRLALSDLAAPSGKRTRALAWDTDGPGWEGWHSLENAAYRLWDEGLRPLLVRNPSKAGSGHLWLPLTRPTDARRAQLAAEVLAPMLAGIKERFPDPKERTGGRIRFPAGAYRPKEGEPVSVLVGQVTGVCAIAWHEGTSPAAWAALVESQSDPAILEATYIPMVCRDAPLPLERERPRPHGVSRGHADIQAWCAANPIDAQVSIERGNKFYAPWRHESKPSVHFYPEQGKFYDYGDPQYQGDAFDLFMILRGHWDPTQPKVKGSNPDHKAAYSDAGIARDGAANEAPSMPLPMENLAADAPLPRAGTSAVHGLAQQELPVVVTDEVEWEVLE